MIQMTDFRWLLEKTLEVSMRTVAIIVIVLPGLWLSRSKRFFKKNKLGISGVIIWTNKGHDTKLSSTRRPAFLASLKAQPEHNKSD
jgi:hypothetical protein